MIHSDTCTHTYMPINNTNLGPLWPFPWVLSNQATAGATCPSQKGKVAIFDISIKLPYEEGGVVVMVVFWVLLLFTLLNNFNNNNNNLKFTMEYSEDKAHFHPIAPYPLPNTIRKLIKNTLLLASITSVKRSLPKSQ